MVIIKRKMTGCPLISLVHHGVNLQSSCQGCQQGVHCEHHGYLWAVWWQGEWAGHQAAALPLLRRLRHGESLARAPGLPQGSPTACPPILLTVFIFSCVPLDIHSAVPRALRVHNLMGLFYLELSASFQECSVLVNSTDRARKLLSSLKIHFGILW